MGVIALNIDSGVLELVFGVLTTMVVVVVWLVRLEGRVNLTEKRHEDLVKHLDVRFESLESVLRTISSQSAAMTHHTKAAVALARSLVQHHGVRQIDSADDDDES